MLFFLMEQPMNQAQIMFTGFREVYTEATISAYFRLIMEPIFLWGPTRLPIIIIMEGGMGISIPTILRFIFPALAVFSAVMGYQVVSILLPRISIAGNTGIRSGGFWVLKLPCRKNSGNIRNGVINFPIPPPTLFSENIFLPI
jgi:hypothetical protein